MTKFKNPALWAYGLFAGFLGGAATAIDSSLALMVIAPDKFNIHEGLKTSLVTAGVLAVLTGAKVMAAYIKQTPLPPIETSDTTVIEKPKE